jgi:addiction module HigA family antidote
MPRLPAHRPPTPPGEVLLHEFIEPHGLTQRAVADAIGVSFQRLNAVVHGRRALTASTALRLARYFGTTASFWTNLQQAADLYEATRAEADALRGITPLAA